MKRKKPKKNAPEPILSPAAKHLAWFKQTLPYHDACNHRTLGDKEPWKYLANRLDAAFLEGVAAGERIAAERVAAHFKRIAADRELPLCPL